MAAGSTPVTERRFSNLDEATDRHHAMSTLATSDAPHLTNGRRILLFHRQTCAVPVPRIPLAKPLPGRHNLRRSIANGAMASLIDPALDHDRPRDPGGLVGDGDGGGLG